MPLFLFLNQDAKDERMDQDHGMNQDAKDERIKQEYILIEKFGLNLKEGDDRILATKNIEPKFLDLEPHRGSIILAGMAR